MAYEIDSERCSSCGECADVCPQAAIAFAGKRGSYQIDPELCVDCGACESVCGSGAPHEIT